MTAGDGWGVGEVYMHCSFVSRFSLLTSLSHYSFSHGHSLPLSSLYHLSFIYLSPPPFLSLFPPFPPHLTSPSSDPAHSGLQRSQGRARELRAMGQQYHAPFHRGRLWEDRGRAHQHKGDSDKGKEDKKRNKSRGERKEEGEGRGERREGESE